MRRPRQFLNSILGVVISAAACSETPSVGPSQARVRVPPPLSAFAVSPRPALAVGEGGVASWLVSCKPLKHEKRDKDIDGKGGSLDIGPHTLVVPAGALSKKTKISAEIVSDSVNTIRFSPEGLQFQTSAYLFLSYKNCTLSTGARLEVIYTSDDLRALLQQLLSFDDVPEQTVVGLLDHFSRYAVAY